MIELLLRIRWWRTDSTEPSRWPDGVRFTKNWSTEWVQTSRGMMIAEVLLNVMSMSVSVPIEFVTLIKTIYIYIHISL